MALLSLICIYRCVFEVNQSALPPKLSVRLVVHTANFALVVYWTRDQVGVRDKRTKKQKWCTPKGIDACLEHKVLMGNAVVSWCVLFSKVAVTTPFHLYIFVQTLMYVGIKLQTMFSNIQLVYIYTLDRPSPSNSRNQGL